jgi:hypothetical protein
MSGGDYVLFFISSVEAAAFSFGLFNQSEIILPYSRSVSLTDSPYIYEDRFDIGTPGNYSLLLFNSSHTEHPISFRYCQFSEIYTDHSETIVLIYRFLLYLHIAFLMLWVGHVLHFPSSFIPLHFFFLLDVLTKISSNYIREKLWKGFGHLAILRIASESLYVAITLTCIGLVCHGWCLFRMNLSLGSLLKIVLPALAQAFLFFVSESAGRSLVVVTSLIVNFLGFIYFVKSTARGIDSIVDRMKKLDENDEPQLAAKLALAANFTRLVLFTLIAVCVFFFMFRLTNAPPLALTILTAVNEVVTGIASLEFFLVREDDAERPPTKAKNKYRYVGRILEPNRGASLVMLTQKLKGRIADG